MDKGAFYLEKMQEHDLRWAKSKEKWASVKNV